MLVKSAVRTDSVAKGNMQVEMMDSHEKSRAAEASHGNPAAAKEWQRRLGGELLKNVSRSFYLTLKFLPGRVRGPISLAYLLARYSDTLADTEAVAVERRLEWLERYRRTVLEGGEDVSALQTALLEGFRPHQENSSEKVLLGHLHECLRWLESETLFHRQAVREVLREILQGQTLDCRRFGDRELTEVLANAEELEEYTYLVAGSVGAFWTRICYHHWESDYATEPRETMDAWGICYGKGLQLVNIVRDLPADLKEGRCYLPLDALRENGMSNPHVPHTEALMAVSAHWEDRCEEHFEKALRYCCAIRSPRLRYATCLPLLLGIRTLDLIRKADWEDRQKGVKVSRVEVKTVLRKALGAQVSTKKLVKLYEELGGRRDPLQL